MTFNWINIFQISVDINNYGVYNGLCNFIWIFVQSSQYFYKQLITEVNKTPLSITKKMLTSVSAIRISINNTAFTPITQIYVLASHMNEMSLSLHPSGCIVHRVTRNKCCNIPSQRRRHNAHTHTYPHTHTLPLDNDAPRRQRDTCTACHTRTHRIKGTATSARKTFSMMLQPVRSGRHVNQVENVSDSNPPHLTCTSKGAPQRHRAAMPVHVHVCAICNITTDALVLRGLLGAEQSSSNSDNDAYAVTYFGIFEGSALILKFTQTFIKIIVLHIWLFYFC